MIGTLLAATFVLFSPHFAPNTRLGPEHVWNRDGCRGANRSPALRWMNAPSGVKSFALTVYDPDAGPSGWWHWVVFNIPVSRHGLDAAVPASAPPLTQGHNDFGAAGYAGPCPPPGAVHHYVFTLYAIDVKHLPASDDVRGAQTRTLLDHHILAQATLIGRYGR